jgi:Tfp pilus assembly protein PilO
MKPTTKKDADGYVEQAFELGFRGVFVQLMVFLDRLSQVQKVVRVDTMAMRPVTASFSRYVELEGTLQIKTYAYATSNADKLSKEAKYDLPTSTGSAGGSGSAGGASGGSAPGKPGAGKGGGP